jgi:hypothetical protein
MTDHSEGSSTQALIDGRLLALNDRRELEIQLVAVGGTQVLIIDNLYRRPADVRRLALGLDFFPPLRGMYPGAFASTGVSAGPVLHQVNSLARDVIGRALTFRGASEDEDVSFAMLTRRRGDLVPIQRQPHIDPNDYTGIIYLNPPAQCAGGTAFWRHRPSGLQAMPLPWSPFLAPLLSRYQARNQEELLQSFATEALSEPMEGYPTRTNRFWELTEVIPMRFNRLVLFNARLFHSGHIPEGAFGDEASSQRLTQNLYLYRRESLS